MEVAKVMPLLIMSGIGYHGKEAARERLSGLFGAKDRYVTMQRLSTIVEVVRLQAASGEDFSPRTPAEFERWVQRNLKIKGGGDPSRDMWGQPIRFFFDGQRLTLVSAGADHAYGTTDDVKLVARRDDY